MVRALSLSRQHPDAGRIAAISASMVANIALFMFLMQPPQASTHAEAEVEPPNIPLVFKKPPPPTPPPPEQRKIEPDHHTVDQVPHPVIKPISPPPVPVINPNPNPMSFQVDKPVVEARNDPPPLPPGPVEKSLNPIESPAPAYPRKELAGDIEGRVELELLVGVDGRVIEVKILHSSGNRNLDAAARDQVLHHWRFEPAMVNGVAVQAIGRVPIVFTLSNQ